VKEWPQLVWETYKSGTSNEVLFTKITDYGFDIADLTDELRGRFHLDSHAMGPVVTTVSEDTLASGAKLKAGDVVLTGRWKTSTRAPISRLA
jgi:hypothetical protein